MSAIRTTAVAGKQYVSVTSAMKLVQQMLKEPEDVFDRDPIHRLEGTGCHAACLDWLAHAFHWIPSYHPPAWPKGHDDPRRWHAVIHAAQTGFQQFVEHYEVEPIGIEQQSLSSTYGLVGHLDLFCSMRYKRSRVKAVVDLKFVAALMESHRLQVRCYGRLDGFRDANIGLLYHADRSTGLWKLEFVNLNEKLEDVAAVSYAAKLWAWNEQRKG